MTSAHAYQCIAHLSHGCLDKGAEVPAACKLVLDVQAPSGPKAAQPLSIDLALEVKGHWWWVMYSVVTRRVKQSQSMGHVRGCCNQQDPLELIPVHAERFKNEMSSISLAILRHTGDMNPF